MRELKRYKVIEDGHNSEIVICAKRANHKDIFISFVDARNELLKRLGQNENKYKNVIKKVKNSLPKNIRSELV